jgi:hypothetical protein
MIDAETEQHLNQEVQTIMHDNHDDHRQRAEQAVALIGRCIGREIGGVTGAYIWGATAIKRKVSRNRWKFLSR